MRRGSHLGIAGYRARIPMLHVSCGAPLSFSQAVSDGTSDCGAVALQPWNWARTAKAADSASE